jgi:hypothetical protein
VPRASETGFDGIAADTTVLTERASRKRGALFTVRTPLQRYFQHGISLPWRYPVERKDADRRLLTTPFEPMTLCHLEERLAVFEGFRG